MFLSYGAIFHSCDRLFLSFGAMLQAFCAMFAYFGAMLRANPTTLSQTSSWHPAILVGGLAQAVRFGAAAEYFGCDVSLLFNRG